MAYQFSPAYTITHVNKEKQLRGVVVSDVFSARELFEFYKKDKSITLVTLGWYNQGKYYALETSHLKNEI